MPGCAALIVHVPAATSVTVVPLTVHTEGVAVANCKGRPELAVAERVSGASPIVWLAGAAKLMDCAAGVTVTVRTTGLAAMYWLFPS